MSEDTTQAVMRCAAIAAQLSSDWWRDYKHGEHRGDLLYQGRSDGGDEIAAAILREFGIKEEPVS